jgi:hypothetical protein
MKKVISILLDKLAVQAGEVAISKAALAKENEESVQYYKWWQDEVAITKQLKKDVADLQAKLEVAECSLPTEDSRLGADTE